MWTDYSVQTLENIPGFQLTKTELAPDDVWLRFSSSPFYKCVFTEPKGNAEKDFHDVSKANNYSN